MASAPRFLLIALFSVVLIPSAQPQDGKAIEKDELGKWINQKNDCPADRSPYFYRLDEFDFKHDGTPQLIAVASTCMTGTAGPDIHSVFSRGADGAIVELAIAEPKDPKTYDNLFGNRNYDLTAEDGLLVATFADDPDRGTPLVIEYKWSGKEFSVSSIQKTGIFQTSYDCAKAESEVEQAICHVESIASPDRELAAVYRSLLAQMSAPERDALRSEQRQWLVERDRLCTPYKGWVSCLSDFYQKRTDSLRKRLAATGRSQSPQRP